MTNPAYDTLRKRLTDIHIFKKLFGNSGLVY